MRVKNMTYKETVIKLCNDEKEEWILSRANAAIVGRFFLPHRNPFVFLIACCIVISLSIVLDYFFSFVVDLHLFSLFHRHRRHREKLQAHFSDSRSLRDCTVNASGLMSKSTPRLQYSLQLQKVRLYQWCIYSFPVTP